MDFSNIRAQKPVIVGEYGRDDWKRIGVIEVGRPDKRRSVYGVYGVRPYSDRFGEWEFYVRSEGHKEGTHHTGESICAVDARTLLTLWLDFMEDEVTYLYLFDQDIKEGTP